MEGEAPTGGHLLRIGPRCKPLESRPPTWTFVHARFVEFLRSQSTLARQDHPWLPAVPDTVYAAIVGGMDEVVSAWVADGRTADLAQLEPDLSYFQLALLAGPEIAKEALA